MKKSILALTLIALTGPVMAKLPPLSPEAQAAAAAAKAKTAWSDKVAAYKLCQAQDKVAKEYLKNHPDAKPSVQTGACADPGPYVPAAQATAQVGVADSKPVPEAGAAKPAEPKK